MREILRSLKDADADDSAPEVWLTHLETGWTLSVYPSGLIQLEADDKKQPLREMSNVELDHVLDLWEILAEGDAKRLLRANWREVER
ncbi:hypothetical protein [Cerasicoccus maritimus]|uniref:hypothetical protein n=1 Tax=Cerasicoccus maritimus TaxID=490089 RepID=UPI002852BE7D|nr:hypothetical protein [Cerasicoccus maritimus]